MPLVHVKLPLCVWVCRPDGRHATRLNVEWYAMLGLPFSVMMLASFASNAQAASVLVALVSIATFPVARSAVPIVVPAIVT